MECSTICRSLNRFFGWVGRIIQPFLLLFIRLFWGTGFLLAGWEKLSNISSTASGFASMHIPAPLFNAYLVGLTEWIGGALLIIGLFSRLISIPLIIIMLVALFTAHYTGVEAVFHSHAFLDLVKEPPFSFLIAMLTILAFGAGLFSLDYFFERKGCKS